jgi:hypothetical protein
MAQYAFGSGSMFGIRSGSNPTPARFGALQDGSVDFTATQKELFGEFQFPIAVAAGTAKIAGKAKFARMQGRAINDLFFNSTLAGGRTEIADREAGTVATAAITVVNNGANFIEDLGVINAVTGLPYVRVASAPAAGQYSVSGTGVYSFNATENANAMQITYSYNVPSTGQKLTITNQVLGAAKAFKTVMTALFDNQRTTLTLNACMATKITFATKLEDFAMQDFDFGGFADAANNIGTWSFAEAS